MGGGVGKMPPEFQIVIAQLAFANSDLAFQGNHLFQGNFYGMNIFDMSNPSSPSLVTSMVCPGGQGDVSVYKNLMFMSVEMPNGRLDCGTQGFPPNPPPQPGHEREGRDAGGAGGSFPRRADLRHHRHQEPEAGGRGADLPRFAHAHAGDDPNDKNNVYIYVSGTSFVRQGEELAGCSNEAPDKDPNTAMFRIEVIKVPVASPQDAKIVSTPRVFMDARTGAMNGLNNGGSHDKDEAEAARHRPVPRHHGVLGDRACGGRVLRKRHPARHQGSR